jgi:hypothetical protein
MKSNIHTGNKKSILMITTSDIGFTGYITEIGAVAG